MYKQNTVDQSYLVCLHTQYKEFLGTKYLFAKMEKLFNTGRLVL